MAYILSCCSTADLSREHFESRDIHYICFHYMLNGKSYSLTARLIRTTLANPFRSISSMPQWQTAPKPAPAR